jgi:hypothetical protein
MLRYGRGINKGALTVVRCFALFPQNPYLPLRTVHVLREKSLLLVNSSIRMVCLILSGASRYRPQNPYLSLRTVHVVLRGKTLLLGNSI